MKIAKLFVTAVLLLVSRCVFAQYGHEYVDLGLPSGTLWATCNIGATSPEDYGSYFAWGETSPKAFYNEKVHKYYDMSKRMFTKYCDVDNQKVLQRGDDAATCNWGGDWYTPTKEQWKELLEYTIHRWTTQNGINGCLITGVNGNTLFLPAVGYKFNESLVYGGEKGWYWSSTLTSSSSTYPRFAWGIRICSPGKCDSELCIDDEFRCTGLPIRPVRSRVASNNNGGSSSNGNYYASNSGTLLYSQSNEVYCDGIYDFDESRDRNGHALHTPNLNLNLEHFRITFSFLALSKQGLYSWGSDYASTGDYQWVIVQGTTRRLGLCLKSDGSILITTNNQDHYYQTNLTYSFFNYMNIDIEYDHGLLKINNNSFYIDMTKDYNDDRGFHSVNYSNGNAFSGYIKDLKIYTY